MERSHSTTLDGWLRAARGDAARRKLVELEPLLEALARSTAALREAERSAARLELLDLPPTGDDGRG